MNSSVFPVLPPAAEMPEGLDKIDDTKRASLPAFNSQPELTTPGTIARNKITAGFTLKRNSTLGPGMVPTSGSLRNSSLVAYPPKKRASAIGATSSPGRLFKTLGDFFLLAGRLEEAAIW